MNVEKKSNSLIFFLRIIHIFVANNSKETINRNGCEEVLCKKKWLENYG